MDGDHPCIIGTACRLPGSVLRLEQLWTLLLEGEWQKCSTSPPPTRRFFNFYSKASPISGQGGWLGEEGVEQFDPAFFGIPLSEAPTLRPNVRLGLELTYEALQNAGIPPSSLRGKRVSVSIGVGTEDGWDMIRWLVDSDAAFDANWAASSDPSGISGRISHAFDFRGPCNTVSTACASGALALREGINSLNHGDADIAIVGALTTHFTPAPFGWAQSTGVASATYRSSAFSPQADGYSPSEGAIFLVLKKHNAAILAGDPIQGIVRAVVSAHNGATRSLITPSVPSQIDVTRRVLQMAELQPEDIHLLEAHGTGTRVGDALEAEAIRTVFGARARNSCSPLLLSSSKAIVGHCHGAAALVGVLKMLGCFSNRQIPPHHVPPLAEFLSGPIIIPTEPQSLPSSGLFAQVNAFGFTGSVSTIVLEAPPLPCVAEQEHTTTEEQYRFLLPFSAKSEIALCSQIHATVQWILNSRPPLSDVAAMLGLCRDHFTQFRYALTVSSYDDIKILSEGVASYKDLEKLIFTSSTDMPIDPRITIDFLNLSPDGASPFQNQSSENDKLYQLLQDSLFIDAAKQLYDRGHSLEFESAYNKSTIDPTLITSSPCCQFDRQRWWKDFPVTTQPKNNHTPSYSSTLSSSKLSDPSFASTKDVQRAPMDDLHDLDVNLGQTAFEDLIQRFGAPIETELKPKISSTSQPPRRTYLITGANGMLGCYLLSRLLRSSNSRIYCVIRGDPLLRLRLTFKRFHQDTKIIENALVDCRLRLLQTNDLCGPQLGLKSGEYVSLLDEVDHIIHLAWPVNFNLPLKDFLPFLAGTRTLADFCYSSTHIVRLYFIGSYASTFNFPSDGVPETELVPDVSISLSQGYAVAKLIAEHSLIKIHKDNPSAFRLSIVRVGQICGDTATGYWSQDELMPMVIASLPALKVLPVPFPPVAWIPSDICAGALFDIAVLDHAPDRHIVHVANPTVIPWTETAAEICEAALGAPGRLVEFSQYVQLIKDCAQPLPVRRLLPYFEHLKETAPDRYSVLDVVASRRCSKALASCPPISGALLQRIVRRVLAESTPSSITRPNVTKNLPPIFLFGPSLATKGLSPDDDILSRIMSLAKASQGRLGDTSKLKGSILYNQLTTFAMQLTTVTSLGKQGILPCAVLGYCFGEYAAAVTAGALSEAVAVDLLVRRAEALRIQEGVVSMLNVFCDIKTIRRILACVTSPPSIAIIAGPSHVVLSGSSSQIHHARADFQRRQIRTIIVDSPIPFHSAQMDNPISQFKVPMYNATSSSVSYISGITASKIDGRLLGVNYWLRHMRETVNFYGGMMFARRTFPGHPFINVGPHATLSKIIERYEWQDVHVYDPEAAHAISVSTLQPLNIPQKTEDAISPTPTEHHQSPISPVSQEHFDVTDPQNMALQVLKEMFGYDPTPELLRRSLQAVGLQSLDFIRFSDYYGAKSGLFLSLSAYISDAPLQDMISSAQKSAHGSHG